jgi:hypothetical protein
VRLTVGHAQHHETAAAQIAGVGVDNRQGEAGGDRGIDGISAGFQYLQTGITGIMLNADDHGVLRLRRGNVRQSAGLTICRRGQQKPEGAEQ